MDTNCQKTDYTLPEAPIPKKKCPDCLECQMCSKNRCELCKKGGHKGSHPELGPFLTHGEYEKWKKRRRKYMIPLVDLWECTDCGSCVEVCPEVFERNSETGSLSVRELPEYPEDCVQEAISVCPVDCIAWGDV